MNSATEQFAKELEDFLRKWKVEVTVVESDSGFNCYATGINFFRYDERDDEGNLAQEWVDHTIGKFKNYR